MYTPSSVTIPTIFQRILREDEPQPESARTTLPVASTHPPTIPPISRRNITSHSVHNMSLSRQPNIARVPSRIVTPSTSPAYATAYSQLGRSQPASTLRHEDRDAFSQFLDNPLSNHATHIPPLHSTSRSHSTRTSTHFPIYTNTVRSQIPPGFTRADSVVRRSPSVAQANGVIPTVPRRATASTVPMTTAHIVPSASAFTPAPSVIYGAGRPPPDPSLHPVQSSGYYPRVPSPTDERLHQVVNLAVREGIAAGISSGMRASHIAGTETASPGLKLDLKTVANSIPKFSGAATDNIREYISRLAKTWNFCHGNPDIFYYILEGSLSHDALNWYKNHEEKIINMEFNDFAVFFHAKFNDLPHFNARFQRLMTLSQMANQSVEQYYREFSNLMDDGLRLDDMLLIALFTNGLAQPIRGQLRIKAPKTLQQAYEDACDLELAFRDVLPPRLVLPVSDARDDPLHRSVGLITSRLDELNTRMAAHEKRDQTLKTQGAASDRSKSPPPPAPHYSPESTFACDFCNSQTHTLEECNRYAKMKASNLQIRAENFARRQGDQRGGYNNRGRGDRFGHGNRTRTDSQTPPATSTSSSSSATQTNAPDNSTTSSAAVRIAEPPTSGFISSIVSPQNPKTTALLVGCLVSSRPPLSTFETLPSLPPSNITTNVLSRLDKSDGEPTSVNDLPPRSGSPTVDLDDTDGEDIYHSAVAFIKVNGESVVTLIDSGACTSLISESFYKKLGIPLTGARSSAPLNASRAPLDVLGSVKIEFELADKKFKATVQVTPILPFDFILGINLLHRMGIVPNHDYTQLSFKDGTSLPLSIFHPIAATDGVVPSPGDNLFEALSEDQSGQHLETLAPIDSISTVADATMFKHPDARPFVSIPSDTDFDKLRESIPKHLLKLVDKKVNEANLKEVQKIQLKALILKNLQPFSVDLNKLKPAKLPPTTSPPPSVSHVACLV